MARDNDRSHRESHIGPNQVGVLTTPGPDITRRAGTRRAHGSQRGAVEIFNRQHAEWTGKEFADDYSALTDAQARAIRRKIRKALYSSDGDFQIRKGTMTYKDAVRKHGFKLSGLRRKLDSTFGLLSMAEASWASDMFIQEVFKVDRTYKPAGSNWVHPRNRVSGTSATVALPDTGQLPKNSRSRNVRYSSRTGSHLGSRTRSKSRQVGTKPTRGGTQASTYSSECSPSRRQNWLSDGEKSGDQEDITEPARETNLSQAAPQLRASRKKRRLRKVIESDEDDGDAEEQSGHEQHEHAENEGSSSEEEQLLRKLEEIRRKRARRTGH